MQTPPPPPNVFFYKIDKVRNEESGRTVGILPEHSHIERHRVKWFGHLTRMPIYQPAQSTYNSKMPRSKAEADPENPGLKVSKNHGLNTAFH